MGLKCLHTSIFIETPSLKGLPTKAKEDPSSHEMRLSLAGYQPSISWSRGIYYYYYYLLLSLFIYLLLFIIIIIIVVVAIIIITIIIILFQVN